MARQWAGPFPSKDYRCHWASPNHYRAKQTSRSSGLIKAQKLFAQYLLAGKSALEAIKLALHLDDGPPTVDRRKDPLPPDQLVSSEAFWAYFSDSRLRRVADDWMRDPIVASKLNRKVQYVKTQVKGYAAVAAEMLAEMMQDATVPPMVRAIAAKEILNRAGVDGKPDAGTKLHDLTDKLRADARKSMEPAPASEGGDPPDGRVVADLSRHRRAAG